MGPMLRLLDHLEVRKAMLPTEAEQAPMTGGTHTHMSIQCLPSYGAQDPKDQGCLFFNTTPMLM